MKFKSFLKHLNFLNFRKKKVIAIVGPTASGKTDLSIQIAKLIDGEIISADSRQMYVELTHGSGKILEIEKENTPHYSLDIFSIFEGQKSISDWLRNARDALSIIFNKGKTPIVVGGTMHFIDALLFDKEFSGAEPNSELRQELESKTCDELVQILENLDKEFLEKVDKKNKVRLIRAIEIASKVGYVPPISQNKSKYRIIWIGIRPDASMLRSRIDTRLEKRWQYILEEVKGLIQNNVDVELLKKLGLEYRYAALFLNKEINEEQAKQELKLKIWQYAKRQMTWWKKNKAIKWFASGDEAYKYFAKNMV